MGVRLPLPAKVKDPDVLVASGFLICGIGSRTGRSEDKPQRRLRVGEDAGGMFAAAQGKEPQRRGTPPTRSKNPRSSDRGFLISIINFEYIYSHLFDTNEGFIVQS